LQISDLVRHLGYSRARIFEMFKAGTGMTPNDYLLRCRVRNARNLLADPERPITEIALETGFSSSQYFSQVFKKYTGMTPSRYRSKTSTVVSGDRF
jgi:two-component system, response regulator YesN